MTTDNWINIFSAIGTCGAVIVSLWLARRDSSPKLKCIISGTRVTFNDKEWFWPNCSKIVSCHKQTYVKRITNTGKIPVYIQSFTIKAHKKKKYLFGINSYDKIELLPGKCFDFEMLMSGMIKQLRNKEYFIPNKRVVFIIHDSFGKEYRFKDSKVREFGEIMSEVEIVERIPKVYN